MNEQLQLLEAQPAHEDILWVMLYYAAHMEKDGETSLYAAKGHPYLDRYVAGWGRPGDYGVIAWRDGQAVGAAWSRIFRDEERTIGYIDDATPEIAVAVLPHIIGQGIGTELMQAYLVGVRKQCSQVALNVRADNPAYRLYQRLGFQTIAEVTNRVGTRSYNMLLVFA
jgi:ribosomal protein S18 acetylase RimI-like enzyme